MWIEQESDHITPSISWYEFLDGPVDQTGIALMETILKTRIIPFPSDHTLEAARIFNAVGRKRNLRVDAMIAAVAIVNNAALATDNRCDFSVFTGQGLCLL